VSPETTLQDIVPLGPDEKARASEGEALARLAQAPGIRELDPTGPWDIVSGSGPLFSAPHAVTHIRDGAEKLGENGTGPLALALARYTAGSAIATAAVQQGDPNWDPGSPYLERAYVLADGNPTVDIHIMRPRGVELCIGLGPVPRLADGLWQIFAEEAVAGGLRFSVNWPFAANARTVTSQLQGRGNKAVQLELSWECFEDRPARDRAWSVMSRAARRLAGQDYVVSHYFTSADLWTTW
jgi:hypothetical protein